jgi:hypothetical protein
MKTAKITLLVVVVFFFTSLATYAKPTKTLKPILPPRLHAGDTVGLLSSSFRPLDEE